MKWRAISSEALHFRAWNDEVVVYNSLSGDTHLIDSATAQLLQLLRAGPADAATLANALAPHFQDIQSADRTIHIEQLLASLDGLALIERV
jgi:PqqD family protein of HPr-rel-A system